MPGHVQHQVETVVLIEMNRRADAVKLWWPVILHICLDLANHLVLFDPWQFGCSNKCMCIFEAVMARMGHHTKALFRQHSVYGCSPEYHTQARKLVLWSVSIGGCCQIAELPRTIAS